MDLRERYCENRACRGATTVRVTRNNGEPFELDVDLAPPAVQHRIVTILAGETLYIEAREAPTRLINLERVDTIAAPSRTLVLRLWQAAGETGAPDMILEVQNPFPRRLDYVIAVQTPESDELRPAQTCPIPGGATAVEHWPHAVFQLVLSGFYLLDPQAPFLCR